MCPNFLLPLAKLDVDGNIIIHLHKVRVLCLDSLLVSWAFWFLLSQLLVTPFASRSQVVSIIVDPHCFVNLNVLDSQATTTLSICTSSLMPSKVFTTCNLNMDVYKPTMELCPPSLFGYQGYYHKHSNWIRNVHVVSSQPLFQLHLDSR